MAREQPTARASTRAATGTRIPMELKRWHGWLILVANLGGAALAFWNLARGGDPLWPLVLLALGAFAVGFATAGRADRTGNGRDEA